MFFFLENEVPNVFPLGTSSYYIPREFCHQCISKFYYFLNQIDYLKAPYISQLQFLSHLLWDCICSDIYLQLP